MTSPLPGSEPPQDPSTQSSEPDPASVFAQQPSTMSRLRDSIAVQPPAGPGALGRLRTGYAAGKQLATEDNAAASQSAPSDGGWGNQGNEGDYATKGDVQAAHDSLSGQLGGVQGGAVQEVAPGIQSRNDAFSGGGSQQSAGPRPDVLGDMAAHNQNMRAQMADSHAMFQASRDRTNQVQANRTAQTASIQAPTASTGMQARGQVQSTGGVTSTGSGIGMSAGQSEATMGGLMKPQNAISDSNYANQKFR